MPSYIKDIGSVPVHKNRFTHRVWGEVRNRVDKKYLVWPSFSSRGIDLKKCSSLFLCLKKIRVFSKSMPLDEKIGHTKYFLSTRFLTSPQTRWVNRFLWNGTEPISLRGGPYFFGFLVFGSFKDIGCIYFTKKPGLRGSKIELTKNIWCGQLFHHLQKKKYIKKTDKHRYNSYL